MTTPDCEICVEFEASHVPEHYLFRGVPEAGRVLAQTDEFVLVPDFAPMMPGHVLLFTRSHALSMADHLRDGADDGELASVLERYSMFYGALAVIEHGSTLEVERARPCIAHAHLHLLPLDADPLIREFTRESAQETTESAWPEIVRAAGHEYVLVGGGESVTMCVDWHPPARQYARSLVGRVLGLLPPQTYSDVCIAPDLVSAIISEWSADDAG
ncbi:HIT domain-containing protein [Microbacterium hydrocarbonoxydans]|uniref:HIT domain-containing protein n=1 Tax=Microbacterium hydrocarbonoxydans TaxID=273678 RepID=UPI003D994275